MLDVALLGTGGMMPLPGRYLTSMLCRLNGRFMMVDCGEGTQVTMKMLGWGFKNLDILCITHFHADHISGLPGLLLTVGNAGREETLYMIGPVGLEKVVRCLLVIAPELPFPIEFIELPFEPGKPVALEQGEFCIGALPVEHRIPCFAYRLEVKRKGKFDVEKAKQLNIPVNFWNKLQKGEEVLFEGKQYTYDMVLGPKRPSIILSYCTDTRPPKGIVDFVRYSDLFICEGIYGEDEKKDKAVEHRHMLFSEAAGIAKEAQVDQLWLTHFSPSLPEPAQFLPVAADIFPNTKIGVDRMTATLYYKD